MAVDFSYLSEINAIAYRYVISRGGRVTDQMLNDAVMPIQPPPWEPHSMEQLLTELDESKSRKTGRPKNDNVIRIQLARQLVDVPETVMPKLLRDCLIARLQSGRRYTDLNLAIRSHRRSERQRRNMFIRGLYEDLKGMVRKGQPLVHEILGPIDESPAQHLTAPREKTLAIVANFLRSEWGENGPRFFGLRDCKS